MQKHILSVDDEPRISGMIQAFLTREGYRVSIAASSEAARRVVQSDPPDLIVLDWQLKDDSMDGPDLAVEIRKTLPTVPIVMMTGVLLDPEVIRESIGDKVSSYLRKTDGLEVLRQEVRCLLEGPGLTSRR